MSARLETPVTSGVTWLRRRASARGVVLLATAFAVQATSGCLSNEYRVRHDELRRLAALPPEARGANVRVSQELGERRGDAIESSNETLAEDDASWNVDISGNLTGPSGGRCCGPQPGAGAWRAPAGAYHGAPASQGFRGAPAAGGFHGAPAAGPLHATPPARIASSGLNLSGGGGGGGGSGDGLVLVAVLVIVGAALATVVLAASEGMRFEGHARMGPDQVLHLTGAAGGLDVRLADLTPEMAATADSALVMDDEGWGLLRLDHARLDRTGPMFRFELGTGVLTLGAERAVAFMSHIETGVFVTPAFGLVLDLGLGSGSIESPCCLGPAVGDDSLSRASLGLEADVLPFAAGPLRFGGFVGGGIAFVGSAGAWQSGPAAAAGPLVELELTSHLALTLRGDASAADLPTGWSTAATLTGGLTIY
jgi:hypothetical protein